MKNKKTTSNVPLKVFCRYLRRFFVFILYLNAGLVFSQSPNTSSTNDIKLIDDFMKSKGYSACISFDASNIKQFWTDLSVYGKDDLIHIALDQEGKKYISKPHKIQLANVDESEECIVDVISSSKGVGFEVLDLNMNPISKDVSTDDFIGKKIKTASFDLIDTNDYAFYLRFSADNNTEISLDRFYLSFKKEKKYEQKKITLEELEGSLEKSEQISDNSFSITGNKITLLTSEYFDSTPSKSIATSLKIKNTGETQTSVYLGYVVYNKDKELLNDKNYPYQGLNQILTVIRANEGDNKILVDTNGTKCVWREAGGCFLAYNAQYDLSDIPNVNLSNGTISAITPIQNNEAEITLTRPLSKSLEKGSKIRIHGISGPNLYFRTQVLKPGEEVSVSYHARKNEDNLKYSTQSFSKGVFYFKPLIYSFSVDPKQDNTILISDYTITH